MYEMDPFITELDLPIDATLKINNNNTNNNIIIGASLETQRPAGSGANIVIHRIPISLETSIRKDNSDNNNVNVQCLIVGRQASVSDLRIQHASISRKHAVFYYLPIRNNNNNNNNNGQPKQNFNLYIKDLSGGKHGTMLNHKRISKGSTIQLQHGDQLVFGNVRESVFTVVMHNDNENDNVVIAKETKSMMAEQQQQAVEAITREEVNDNNIESTIITTTSSSQHVMEMTAGHGLSGREKRQAEIQAMMVSLDHAPVYHSAAATIGEDDEHQLAVVMDTQQQQQQQQETTILQQQHPLLPVQSSFRIPPSTNINEDTSTKRSHAAIGITCLAVDASGSRFVVGSRDYHLRFYNFSGMDQRRRECYHDVIPQDGHILVDVAYSNTSGSDRILVGTGSVQPMILNSESGTEIIKFVRGDMYVKDQSKTVGHTAAVTSVDWHPLERDIVLTGSMDGSARLWNVNSGKTQFQMLVCEKVFQAKTLRGQRTAVTCVCFHPNGREFAMGTSCGSIQIWNASSPRASGRPERAIYHAHGGGGDSSGNDKQQQQDYPIYALVYSQDGSRLASRSSIDNCAKVWNPKRLSRSSTPLVICMGLPTVHERANLGFSPNGKYLCGGATALLTDQAESTGKGGEGIQRQRQRELGSLNFYDVSKTDNFMDNDDDTAVVVEPLAAIEMNDNNAGPVIVKWHVKLNQILVGCSDGSVIIYYDSKISRNGALIPLAKASRSGATAGADDLAELIRLRAPKGSAAAAALSKGEIIAPLALPRRPNKRQREEQAAEAQIQKREPERPTSGKHKAGGGSSASATTTFAQFIADQTVVKTKAIAGKDPREALLQYTEGKSYLGNETKILDTKTVEQEDEELKQKR